MGGLILSRPSRCLKLVFLVSLAEKMLFSGPSSRPFSGSLLGPYIFICRWPLAAPSSTLWAPRSSLLAQDNPNSLQHLAPKRPIKAESSLVLFLMTLVNPSVIFNICRQTQAPSTEASAFSDISTLGHPYFRRISKSSYWGIFLGVLGSEDTQGTQRLAMTLSKETSFIFFLPLTPLHLWPG